LLLAAVINNLGVIAFERGQYGESLKLQREAWAIRHQSAPDSAEEAMSYTNIGDSQRALGDHAQAYTAYQTALAMAEQSVGGEHPYVGDALVGIGKCQLHAGHASDAVAPLERALAIRKQGSRPVELADVELSLAGAVFATDPARARTLATSARDAFAASKSSTKELAEAEAWLAAHR
jgi:tetratricopeptide (TPR) repeat protein